MFYYLYYFITYSIRTLLNRQKLERTIEPMLLTTEENAVLDFTSTLKLNYSVVYGLFIFFINRISNKSFKNANHDLKVINLGSGPGICSTLINKYTPYKKVIGVDLSEAMIDVANRYVNLQNQGNDIEFAKCDITNLNLYIDKSFDLVTSLDASHHLPSHLHLKKMINESERICNDEGIIFIFDLLRPKTKDLAEGYVKWMGANTLLKGKKYFYEDFYHSVMAAWSKEEFISAVPPNTNTIWYHLQAFGFSPIQMLVGVSKNHGDLIKTQNPNLDFIKNIIPKEYWGLWLLSKNVYKKSIVTKLQPHH